LRDRFQDGRVARGIQSIVLGFRLVEIIAEAGVPLSLKAISALSGMSPSKARMYLISFIETGLVTQNPESALYGLGPYALRLGARAMQRMELVSVATEDMNALQQQTNALVLLSAWNAHGVTIVSRSDGSEEPPPLQFPIGGSASLGSTATGHVFLAFGPHEPIWRHLHEELAALGLTRAEQKQRVKELEALAADVRKRRIALTDPISYASGVTVSGYAALAAPVFDVAQRLRYAVTLVYQTGRDKRRRNKFSRLTLQAAERLSHLAGAGASGPGS
jgi:DNA-binding IclR family transcriptional regulator